MIRLYLKIPEEFVRLILKDRFWVMHIPFVRMVKFKFLAHFLVDRLAHPVVSRLTQNFLANGKQDGRCEVKRSTVCFI